MQYALDDCCIVWGFCLFIISLCGTATATQRVAQPANGTKEKKERTNMAQPSSILNEGASRCRGVGLLEIFYFLEVE